MRGRRNDKGFAAKPHGHAVAAPGMRLVDIGGARDAQGRAEPPGRRAGSRTTSAVPRNAVRVAALDSRIRHASRQGCYGCGARHKVVAILSVVIGRLTTVFVSASNRELDMNRRSRRSRRAPRNRHASPEYPLRDVMHAVRFVDTRYAITLPAAVARPRAGRDDRSGALRSSPRSSAAATPSTARRRRPCGFIPSR